MTREIWVNHIKVFSDSQLIVAQVQEKYEAKEPTMVRYLQKIKELALNFETLDVQQILRSENLRAVALSHFAISEC